MQQWTGREHQSRMVAAALATGMATAALLAAMPASAQREPPPSREAAQYSFAPIVKKAAPAVVNVYVRARVQTFVSPFAEDRCSAASSASASACRRSACRARWARA